MTHPECTLHRRRADYTITNRVQTLDMNYMTIERMAQNDTN